MRYSLFRSFTGLTVSEFNFICKEIVHNYEEQERRTFISRKKRIRDVGAGRPLIPLHFSV
ncbi:MAG: hypothetical protein WAM14_21135 [Candidatus Nitrosopolaris sp.]